jgi:hypothetical protein
MRWRSASLPVRAGQLYKSSALVSTIDEIKVSSGTHRHRVAKLREQMLSPENDGQGLMFTNMSTLELPLNASLNQAHVRAACFRYNARMVACEEGYLQEERELGVSVRYMLRLLRQGRNHISEST